MEPRVIRKSRTAQLNEILADAQKRSYFVVAITVLFFILFLVLGVIPAYSDVFSQISENNVINGAIAEAEKKKADLEALVEERQTDSSLINQFDRLIMPDLNQQQDIISELYEKEKELDLKITNLTFTENVDSLELQDLWFLNDFTQSGEFRIDVEGTLTDVLSLIQFLDSSRRIYHTESISLFGDASANTTDLANEPQQQIEQVDLILTDSDIYKLSLTVKYFYWDSTIFDEEF